MTRSIESRYLNRLQQYGVNTPTEIEIPIGSVCRDITNLEDNLLLWVEYDLNQVRYTQTTSIYVVRNEEYIPNKATAYLGTVCESVEFYDTLHTYYWHFYSDGSLTR